MPLYLFRTDSGIEVERFYPMGKCPTSIDLDDGDVAKRVYAFNAINFSKGPLSSNAADKLKRDMTKRNKSAGERGRDYWKSKSKSWSNYQ